MHVKEIKRRVTEHEYEVDPRLVADAMLRHAISYRRWWNPHSTCLTPADARLTPGDSPLT